MPTYRFICKPCKEHPEQIVRDVFMNIQHFEDGGKEQTCDICLRPMQQEFGKPAIILKGKGFYKTDYPKPLPDKEIAPMERHLEQEYVERAVKSGDYDAARDRTETFVVDQYRDTTTGKKVNKPVIVPPLED